MKRVIPVLATALVLILAGCGKKAPINELRSLVFNPDYYVNGTPAVYYPYLLICDFRFDVLENDRTVDGATFPKGTIYDVSPAVNIDDMTPEEIVKALEYGIGNTSYAFFNLNPSTFCVDDAQWRLLGFDKKWLTKSDDDDDDDAESWYPRLVSVEGEGEQAVVGFEIVRPDWMRKMSDGVVPTFTLEAVFDRGRAISSDFALIDPVCFKFKTFAISNDGGETIWSVDYTGLLNTPGAKQSFNVMSGTYLYLEQYLYVWYEDEDGFLQSQKVNDFIAMFPKVELNMELIPYRMGTNEKTEDTYARLDGMKLYVSNDSDAKGHFPVVRVSLTCGKRVLSSFYLKINIAV